MDIQKNLDKLALAASQKLKEKSYWTTQLSGEIISSHFPFDYPYTGVEGVEIDEKPLEEMSFRLEGPLYTSMMEIGSDSAFALHLILTASLVALLYRYTGQEDIIVATPIYKQDKQGEFINTILPLRQRLHENITFKDLLLKVKKLMAGAVEHQSYPIELLAGRLKSAGANVIEGGGLFDTVILLRNIQDRTYLQDARPGMIYSFLETGHDLELEVEYNSRLYHRSTIQRLVRHLEHLMSNALMNLDLDIPHVRIMGEEEKKNLLETFNLTGVGYPADKTLQQLFAEQVEQTLDQIALIGAPELRFEGTGGLAPLSAPISLTYRQLNEKSHQLAYRLKEKGIGSDTIVAIMVERSVEMIVGILAILKAGGAYLPIDPDYPEERIQYMLNDSGAKILLKDNDFSTLPSFYPSTLLPFYPSSPLNLAYIIYTSGTTGKPKGVMIEQKNVVRLFFMDTPRFDFHSSDTWTMFHSPCFDFSVWEMYGALLYGGKLVIVSKQTARDPAAFLKILKAQQVSVLNQTPSAFYSLILEELTSTKKDLNLRYVIFGGEALKPAKLNEWYRRYPCTKLVNMFGITETTVHVTYKEIAQEEIQFGVSNIGLPLPALSTSVLGPHMNLLPIGIWGELYVGGEGVARGYINQPELTNQKFLRGGPGGALFSKSAPPGRRRLKIYKSGDLVRVMDGGDLEYYGRIDHQVQVRGFRVELGEIEHRLIQHPGIKEVVVLPVDREDGLLLYAYIVPSSPRVLNVPQLKEFLAGKLPGYMIPHHFVTVEQIPLTLNGKVDRKALLEIGTVLEGEYIPPRNPAEEKLAALWSEVLKKEKVGIKENFFDIGGDSIKAIRLANLVNNEFNIDLRVVDLYTHATIGLLSGKVAGSVQFISRKETERVTAEIEALKNRITRENDLARDIEDVYPLSDIEKGIVFYYLKHPGSGLYHDQFVYPIKYRKFEFERLKQAMTLMVQKHSILRTGFNLEDYEEHLQLVYKEPVLDMEYWDLSHKNRAEQEAYIARCMAMDRKTPFNESIPPLWRIKVFGIDETTIMVLFICHHAILDGWSVASLMTELHNTYLQLRTDPQSIPLPLRATYKDAVINEIAEKTDPGVIEYWKKELSDYSRLSFADILSGDYGHEKMKIFSKNLGTAILKKLRKTAGIYNTTINHLCFGAYAFIISMLANESDIVVGCVTNNRPVIPDGDKIVGCFLNTVPVRVKMPTGRTWAQYIRFIENKMLEIKEFERFSLFEIARVTGEKTRDRNPIFDTLFNFKDFHIFREAHTSGESIETYDSVPLQVDRSEDTNTLFDFEVDITGNSLGLDLKYKPFAISNQRVTQCFTYFKQIIDKLINEPGAVTWKNDIIPSQEKKQLLEEFNDTDVPYSRHKTMHQLFEEQVEKTPQEVSAIGTDGKQQLTYRELNHRSNQLAWVLRKRGVIPGYLVAVIMDRSLVMVTAVMGILKAGGAYVPLEIYLPDERIRKIMESLNIRTLLTNARQFSKVVKIARELLLLEHIICLDGKPRPGLETEVGEEIRPGKTLIITPRDLEREAGDNPAPSAASEDIAYIIFTSGSTGIPKGVVETHRPVVNVIEWVNRTFALAPPDKLLFVASLGFDLSVYDIFGILASGACLRVVSGEDIRSPQVLLDIIMKEGITFWDSAPAALQQLVPFFPEVSGHPGRSRLRLVFLSGDWIPVTMPDAVRDTFAGVQVISLGGATEATIWSNYYPIDVVDPSWPSIPYGKPIQNARYYILDRNLELCPLRVPGDLYIGGQCLAAGYINDAQLTASKFLDNPYAPGEKIYKTGDIACWFEDGNMQFLGRKDHQVKIRGFRVELGEIEAQLLKHPLIGDGVVVDREDASGSKYLCAYYIPKHPETDIDKAGLKDHLAGELPEYMIPAYFIPIDKIPLTANGKLDRKALPKPEGTIKAKRSYAAPVNEIQETLVEIWSHVLFARNSASLQTPIGIDDDFFELGGHSLNATIAVSRIHKELNVKIPLAEIFNSPTIRELSNKVKVSARAFYTSIDPVEKKEYYILSSAQMRLYFLQQMELKSIGYNIQEAVILEEPLDIDLLQKTFKRLIQRHESLRTSFHFIDGKPVQEVHNCDEVDFEMEYYDMKEIEESIEEGRVEGWKGRRVEKKNAFSGSDKEGTGGLAPLLGLAPLPLKSATRNSQPVTALISSFIRPFDLSQAPLLRVGLIRPTHTLSALRSRLSPEKKENKYLLMVDMHHIISDGISHAILIRDFMDFYQGKQPVNIPIQYKDYAQYQSRDLRQEAVKKQEAYWLKELAGDIPVLNIPADFPRPKIQTYEGSTCYFEIGPRGKQGLNRLVLGETATLFMGLLAVFNVLLSRVCSQEDIIIGTPIAGRQHADLENVIGMFVNTLVLRNYPSGEKPFSHFLAEVKEKTLQAFENQDYQFEDLVDKVAVGRDVSRNPLFDVMFVLQNMQVSPAAASTPQSANRGEDHTLRVQPYRYDPAVSRFDLALNAWETPTGIQFKVEFYTRIFQEGTIERFIGYFKKIIDAVIEFPGQRICQIDLVADPEKKLILYDFNRTEAEFPHEKAIHELFKDQAQRTPDRVALVGIHENHEIPGKNHHMCHMSYMSYLSYQELNEKSHRLALRLKEKGVKPDTIVGIMLERSVDMIIGIFAILKAGGAYLPLDPQYPTERIQYILKDSNAQALIVDDTSYASCLSFAPKALLNLSEGHHLNFPASQLPSFSASLPSSLAYTIYTSGSTGNPKGVLVEHSSVVNLAYSQKVRFDINENDRVLQFSTICFDASVEQIFITLFSGAVLVLIDKNTLLDPRGFDEFMSRHSITHIHAVPSFLSNMKLTAASISTLKRVIAGGDICPVELARTWSRYCDFYNEYGPTETTVTSIEILVKTPDEGLPRLPIGKPLHNTSVYLLDRWMKVVPLGAVGELYLGGKGVARGYINHPELTAEKFCPQQPVRKCFEGTRGLAPLLFTGTGNNHMQPCNHAAMQLSPHHLPQYPITPLPHHPLYRTGDLARWLPDGNIEFLGRMDNQVKIRGFRVELGEIEHHLLNHKQIKEAVVLIKEIGKSEKYLCAYIVAGKPGVSPASLREYLSARLPHYMVPAHFVLLERLPLSPSGKIDRQLLLTYKDAADGSTAGYVAPNTTLEKIIARAWKEVLGLDRVGLNDRFFDIGGNSANILRVHHQLKQVIGVDLPIMAMFLNPTIYSLVSYLGGEGLDTKGIEMMENQRLDTDKTRMKQSLQKLGASLNDPRE
jgi:amino acid adenylation domain-containing protein